MCKKKCFFLYPQFIVGPRLHQSAQDDIVSCCRSLLACEVNRLRPASLAAVQIFIHRIDFDPTLGATGSRARLFTAQTVNSRRQ